MNLGGTCRCWCLLKRQFRIVHKLECCCFFSSSLWARMYVKTWTKISGQENAYSLLWITTPRNSSVFIIAACEDMPHTSIGILSMLRLLEWVFSFNLSFNVYLLLLKCEIQPINFIRAHISWVFAWGKHSAALATSGERGTARWSRGFIRNVE